MAYYHASIDLIFQVDDENEISDALTGILTEQMKKYAGPNSALIDWCYKSSPISITLDDTYEPDESPWPYL